MKQLTESQEKMTKIKLLLLYSFLAMGVLVVSANNVISQDAETQESIRELVPGVYAVINNDGSITITSSDTNALDELQEKLLSLNGQLAPSTPNSTTGESVEESRFFSSREALSGNGDEQETSSKNIAHLTRQNREQAQEKLVMEGRDFSVYKIENISVNQILPRLQLYLANRINPPKISNAYYGGGINIGTINNGPRITFEPDVNINTLLVRGSRADRDEVGAMIVVLDKADLFPQPITKPYKVRVRNMSVTKMTQQVLVAFQRKMMATRLPGDQFPRISPNTATSTLEIYAPESLAKEIEEYVKEMDEEIIKDPVRKVHIVELKDINSQVLSRYLTNLNQANMMRAMMSNPYMNNSYGMNPYPTTSPYTQSPYGVRRGF